LLFSQREIKEINLIKMKIFFNSSMPRSCSTLFQNILANNPDFYATPTSTLLDMLLVSKKVYSTSSTVKAQDEEEMKKAFLMYSRFAVDGFFHGITDKPYVIDKSRGWAINMPYLKSFYPNPKVICLVRDLRDIVASMEKNYLKNPDKTPASTLPERVTMWMNNQSKPVGSTLSNLKEVIHRGFDKEIKFIRCEDLCDDPASVMKDVYNYLEVPYREVDYQNIIQVTNEDDKFHGIYGNHKIKPSIEPLQSDGLEVLGELIYDQLYEANKWYFQYFNYLK
jgi:sulfotransferase